MDEETGLYYYGARYYNPSTSVWLSVDPISARDAGHTPYHFVLNNPVMLIDPKGLTWEPGGQDVIGNLVGSITKKRDNYSAKFDKYYAKFEKHRAKGNTNRTNRYKKKAIDALNGKDEMNKSLNDITQMGRSSQAYDLRKVEGEVAEPFMNDKGVIVIEFVSETNLIHELVHGYQHLNGDLVFHRGGNQYYDCTDEVEAYRRQYYFNKMSFDWIFSTEPAIKNNKKGVEAITPEWVKGAYLYDYKTGKSKYLYSELPLAKKSRTNEE